MTTEHEIDALLSRDETGSIIDRLMAMPSAAGAAQGADEWDRAVAVRFEAHLARRMRALIDGAGSDRHAA